MKAIVTGGAGFIGSELVTKLLADGHSVLNIDKLTYAGDLRNLAHCESNSDYEIMVADICDTDAIQKAFSDFDPDAVFHLAAESHVDRSIDGPKQFLDTNINGTFVMLEAALAHIRKKPDLKFLHVSTDEVYGALGATGLFTEDTPYSPNSPYSASKAASDHLVRAWFKTFGLPADISNCSNNYGPRQHPEKLIPTIIRNAVTGQPIPIYGDGKNVRDWLYVSDHIDAMLTIIDKGREGEKYNIGGDNEITNISIAQTICAALDTQKPLPNDASYADQITFVTDRPGHDFRYAIDPTKVREELNWEPKHSFETGIATTIEWYLANPDRYEIPNPSEQRLGLKRA